MTIQQIRIVKEIIIELTRQPIMIQIDTIKDMANERLGQYEQLTREKTARILAYLIEHSKKES